MIAAVCARHLLTLTLCLPLLPACQALQSDGRASEEERGSGGDAAAPEELMKHITLEDIATYPLPGMSFPQRIKFTRDGKAITFLDSKDGSLRRELFSLNLESGSRALVLNAGDAGITEENISLEEKLRRERARERGLGITTYQWSRENDTLLVPLAGALQVQHGLQGSLKTVVAKSESPPLAPRLSPDGDFVAYVMDEELYVSNVDTGARVQLTTGARGTGKTNGLAEYIAQEEMGRSTGFWWSKDATQLAFIQVDETHIPEYRIVHQGKDAVGEGAEENHRYPFAGEANARVRLGVVPRVGGTVRWMDLGDESDIYLPRVQWMPDGSLWVQRQNRAQTTLDLLRFDPSTGTSSQILKETTEVWINLHNMLRPIEEGPLAGHFLWASERSGYRHLYLYDGEGTMVRPLTSGEWMVDRLVAVDEKGGRVFFEGTKDDPRERHLYVIGMDGAGLSRVTKSPGMHSTTINKTFTAYIDTHHTTESAPTIHVRSLSDGTIVQTIHDEVDPRTAKLGLTPPELVSFKTQDGVTLYGAVYRPPEQSDPSPLIVSVYGGPHAQRVTNSWGMTVDLRAQYLRQEGFTVLKVDNRGSARRGLAFEGAIKHDMGNLEVRDQVEGVEWLAAQGGVDPSKVGIYGWSYGGYMSAMALARAPETFKVAVAGAPVTHWDGYDTHYTERYMGTPATNPDGYAASAVMKHIDGMTGHLMLVHGLIDENVHFRHTARLINALIAKRKDYELLMFPDERHMPRALADRVYMEERVFDFFDDHLRR